LENRACTQSERWATQ